MKKIVVVWLVCVLGLVGLFAWLGTNVVPREAQISSSVPVKADFTLQGGGGKTFTNKDFQGSYLFVYFGFTHCPDICPTTLLLMNNAVESLGDRAKKVKILFISVDPERDTPQVATDYANHFGNVIGLSGTPEQIKHAADSFKVYYSKVEDESSALGYVMDHSGYIYLMGPRGEYLAHFSHENSEQEVKKGLMQYVK